MVPLLKFMKLLSTLFTVLLVAALLLASTGCGSSEGVTGGDSPNGLVPDYQAPVQKAKDVSNLATQKQKDLEDSSNQIMQTP